MIKIDYEVIVKYNGDILKLENELGVSVDTAKRDGDRIQRGKVSKKLSRLFIDEKIPKELRDKLPVIRNKDGVLGVLGINTKVNKNKKYDYYINTKG